MILSEMWYRRNGDRHTIMKIIWTRSAPGSGEECLSGAPAEKAAGKIPGNGSGGGFLCGRKRSFPVLLYGCGGHDGSADDVIDHITSGGMGSGIGNGRHQYGCPEWGCLADAHQMGCGTDGIGGGAASGPAV